MADLQALGGILPVINKSISIVNTIDRADRLLNRKSGSKDRDLALRQLRQRQASEEKIAATRTARDQMILDAESASTERRRLNALKRETARQNAAFGGAGVDSETGSGEAVLLGLFQESEDDKRDQDSITALRRQILTDNFAALKSRNLLDYAQTSERRS